MKPGHDYPPIATDTTLLPWLLATLAPMNRTRVKELLASGRVMVNSESTTKHDHRLAIGDRVSIARERPKVSLAKTPIIYEDESIIAIDKPSGLLTVATDSEKADTAFVRLSEHLKAAHSGRPYVVHRIDRGTSGILLFARSAAVRDQLQAEWESVEKTYLAVVEGSPPSESGRIENYLFEGTNLRVRARATPAEGGLRAVSRYRVLSRTARNSLVEVVIETGRKHQIRVHMAGLNCPIIGDADYGAKTNPARRLGLHGTRLSFPHPITRQRIELHSPPPDVLMRVMKKSR